MVHVIWKDTITERVAEIFLIEGNKINNERYNNNSYEGGGDYKKKNLKNVLATSTYFIYYDLLTDKRQTDDWKYLR